MRDAASFPQSPAEPLFASAAERADRILYAKLRILYQGVFAVPTNLVVATAAVILLRHSYPLMLLGVWYGATAAVAGLRLALHQRFRKAIEGGERGKRWSVYFCGGALASGLLWGLLCLGLPIYGTPGDYVLLTLIAAGMTAGALTTLAPYLPAYLCYACAFALPMAGASILYPDPQIATNGWLALVYTVMICAAAAKLNGDVSRTIELQVDNAALNLSLNRARIERDIARTDKWSMISQLSHEMRTPLNAILGFSETMMAQLFGPLGHGQYVEYAGHVHSSGKHLLNLITELLRLSQGETRTLTLTESEFDVAGAVSACLKDLMSAANRAGVTLTKSVSPDLPLLRADAAKFRQILLNLARNAIKFTPAAGRVDVDVWPNDEGGIDLVVRDNGIGMSSQEIALAVEPFGRIASPLHHKTDGMGLGLPICKRLAELHAAVLRIESEPGKGTACTVSFPPSRAIAGPAADRREARTSKRTGAAA